MFGFAAGGVVAGRVGSGIEMDRATRMEVRGREADARGDLRNSTR